MATGDAWLEGFQMRLDAAGSGSGERWWWLSMVKTEVAGPYIFF